MIGSDFKKRPFDMYLDYHGFEHMSCEYNILVKDYGKCPYVGPEPKPTSAYDKLLSIPLLIMSSATCWRCLAAM